MCGHFSFESKKCLYLGRCMCGKAVRCGVINYFSRNVLKINSDWRKKLVYYILYVLKLDQEVTLWIIGLWTYGALVCSVLNGSEKLASAYLPNLQVTTLNPNLWRFQCHCMLKIILSKHIRLKIIGNIQYLAHSCTKYLDVEFLNPAK